MHAGDGKKGEGQRAKGDKISVGKGRWAKRSDSREKNARRGWEERRRPACTRSKNPRRKRGDRQSGVTAERKMHAGDGGKVEASVHKETKSPPAETRWAKRSDSREKNARRRWEERRRPACTRRQNLRRQRGDGQSGVTAGRKMHAGDGKKGIGRRAQGSQNLRWQGEMGKAE